MKIWWQGGTNRTNEDVVVLLRRDFLIHFSFGVARNANDGMQCEELSVTTWSCNDTTIFVEWITAVAFTVTHHHGASVSTWFSISMENHPKPNYNPNVYFLDDICRRHGATVHLFTGDIEVGEASIITVASLSLLWMFASSRGDFLSPISSPEDAIRNEKKALLSSPSS